MRVYAEGRLFIIGSMCSADEAFFNDAVLSAQSESRSSYWADEEPADARRYVGDPGRSLRSTMVVAMRRATVYDVAERAGVSTATVSFTFHHSDKVRPATREKALRAAGELNYMPSANARGLARGRTGVFGLYSFDMLIERPLGDEDDAVVFDAGQVDAENHDGPDVLAHPLYVDEVQRGFELECWHRGRNVLPGSASAANEGVGITDIAIRVDGLSLYSTGQNATNYSVLLAGAVLVITPILLLFIFLQRYFIQGVTMTVIK
jgi:hypothetical protein